jgi:HEAT repeat protein
MKRHWRYVVLSIAGVTAIAVVLASVFAPREPVFQSKPLSYWVEQLDGPNRREAQTALHEIGSKGVFFLFGKLHSDVSFYRRILRATWKVLPGWVQQKLPSPKARDGVLIYQMGCALAQLGPSAVPGLTKALNSGDDAVRLAAMNAIGIIGSGAHAAIPRLTTLLKTSNPWCRGRLVVSLVSYGRDETESLLALSHPGPTKAIAAWALGKIGPEAHGAVGELTKLLSDKDPHARQEAAIAMWRISGLTNGLEILVSGLQTSPDSVTCCRLLSALGEMGSLARPAVPAILTLLTKPGQSVTFPNVSRIGREALERIDLGAAAQFESSQKP